MRISGLEKLFKFMAVAEGPLGEKDLIRSENPIIRNRLSELESRVSCMVDILDHKEQEIKLIAEETNLQNFMLRNPFLS